MKECSCAECEWYRDECDWYRDKLHDTGEALSNARNALISAGQTAVTAIERIQVLEDRAENAAPVLLAANNLVHAAEDNDGKRGEVLGAELARVVLEWRKTLPS